MALRGLTPPDTVMNGVRLLAAFLASGINVVIGIRQARLGPHRVSDGTEIHPLLPWFERLFALGPEDVLGGTDIDSAPDGLV